RIEAAAPGGPRGHRLDQLPDAMHDEGDLRPVLVQAPRPAHRQGILRLLLLRSGPAHGRDGLGQPAHAPARKLTAGKALRALAGLPSSANHSAPGVTLATAFLYRSLRRRRAACPGAATASPPRAAQCDPA